MGLLKIYNVAQSKILVANDQSLEQALIPFLNSGDLVDLEFMLLEQRIGGGFNQPWSRIAVGSYALEIGLFNAATREQLTYQNVWTGNGISNVYTGQLSLATDPINTAFGGAATQLDCTLEISILDAQGGAWTSYRQNLTLYKSLITAGAVVPAAGQIAATEAWTNGLFVPQASTRFVPQIIQSPGGRRFKFWVDDNAVPHFDPI